MKLEAIQEATIRLERAHAALSILENANSTVKEMDSAWASFLLAANAIYSKLQQGAKRNRESEAWFAQKRDIRANDPLLHYLHEARNSEEHSLEIIAAPGIVSLESLHEDVIVSNSDGIARVDFKDNAGFRPGEPLAQLTIGVRIQAVKNQRSRITIPVPASHMGHAIQSCSAVEVTKLGLAYLENLVAEAAMLVK